jgi:large subunit ribosomal protein L15
VNLSDLRPATGSRRSRKRLGRGLGSGLGKTSGKGHKGQKARSGGGVRPGFEGGQMPLVRRIPKQGFTPPRRRRFAEVNLEALAAFEAGTVVTPELLVSEGILHRAEAGRVKILGTLAEGHAVPTLTVRAHAFSASARAAIEAAGGSVEVV